MEKMQPCESVSGKDKGEQVASDVPRHSQTGDKHIGDKQIVGKYIGEQKKKTKSVPDKQKNKKRPPKKGKPKKRKKKTTKQLLIDLLIKIVVIALIVWVMLTFVLGLNVHYGNNMHPSISDGDLVVSFRLQKPYINAVVLYEHDGETKIGRVIALGGNTVNITSKGEFTINGITPSEEVFYPTYPAKDSSVQYPYKVEPDKVFILNDFRTDTKDSRSFGAVDVSDLKGPLLFIMRHRGF